MRKREHLGTVISIEGQRALVRLKVDASCRVSFGCAACSSFRPDALTIRVARDSLEEGDTVRVSVPAYQGYLSTFVVFVLPLVLTIVGFVVGGRFEQSGGARGMPTIVGGVVGFLLAVAVAMLVNRRLADASNYEVQRVKAGER